MFSGTRCPYVSVCECEVIRGAAAPKGWDLGLKAWILASRLESGLQFWELGLEAENWALRLGIWPQGWELGLKAGI